MSDLVIASHRGPYSVSFDGRALDAEPPAHAHYVLDARVAELHANRLERVLRAHSVLTVVATESAKSLDKMEGYVEHLVTREVRRGDVIVAIGGGIIQDITCFLATTLLRGLEWQFYPTTLLAQADSCIGSKSSINVGKKKNLLGTFHPPSKIFVDAQVLDTLEERDVHSGIGEMLKVHAIDGPESFDAIASDYERLLSDRDVMLRYVRRALEIKKRFIEEDEFDRGVRNVMNYGHSFGHAIESATDYAVPHGIAVTIGMDMANFVAARMGRSSQSHYARMHGTLAKNYAGFERVDVPAERLFAALDKDKKNLHGALRLILPDDAGRVSVVSYPNDEPFQSACTTYLQHERG